MRDSVRKKVWARDDGICWHCGTTENLQIHHRINRGMGGSKLLDRGSNLILLCAEFNYKIESDLTAARRARKLGIKVSRHGDVLRAPIQDAIGRWFMLDDFYKKHEVEFKNEFREDN